MTHVIVSTTVAPYKAQAGEDCYWLDSAEGMIAAADEHGRALSFFVAIEAPNPQLIGFERLMARLDQFLFRSTRWRFSIDTGERELTTSNRLVRICHPPGTRIRKADGSEAIIETIVPGDLVVTAEGATAFVSGASGRWHDGTIARLRLWGHNHLRLTAEHPVLTQRGYVPAAALEPGDAVALPKFMASGLDSFDTAPFVRGVRRSLNAVPEKLELDEETGRLIGLFLAEGSTDHSQAIWTFGGHEPALIDETLRLIRRRWNPRARIRRQASGAVNVVLPGRGWARLLRGLAGTGAANKRPHPALLGAGKDFLRAMLLGWLDRDGHSRRGTVEGTTISHDLALAMFDIGQALGLRPTIARKEAVQNQAAAHRRPVWNVAIPRLVADARRKARPTGGIHASEDASHVWRRVRSVEVEEYVGPVFNLEIQGAGSYVAEGVGVHNCTGRNLAIEHAVRAGASHVLFLDSDVSPPADIVSKLLEVDWPIVGAEVPTYCLSGPVVEGYPFPIMEHWNTAGALMVTRDVFRRVRWRWDPDAGMTDDPCFAADVEAAGFGKTRVRKDVICRHYPEAIGPLETRGQDLRIDA